MEQQAFSALAGYGLPGIIIFGLAAWVVVLHRELRDERRARIDDAKEGFAAMLGAQDRTTAMGATLKSAVEKLVTATDDLKEIARDLPRRRP